MARVEKANSFRKSPLSLKSMDQIDAKLSLVFSLRAITISRKSISRVFFIASIISSGLSSERIILSPFTKEFRGEGHSYESLNFSGATNVAISIYHVLKSLHSCVFIRWSH